MQKLIYIILMGIALNGCISKTGISVENKPVEISAGVYLDLLPPESMGQNIFLTQSAEVFFNSEKYELLLYVEISQENIAVIGLMPNGTRLFSISYDGNTLQSEGYSAIIEELKPEYFLSDLQFSLWPLTELERSFEIIPCFIIGECILEEVDNGMGRVLKINGEDEIVVRYTGLATYEGSIEFYHKSRDYELIINTIDIEVL